MIAVCLLAIMMILPVQVIATPTPKLLTATLPNGDDPEGRDGPDDFTDWKYLSIGLLITYILGRDYIKFWKAPYEKESWEVISMLIGDGTGLAMMAFMFAEAFDYRDIDRDGH